MKATAVAGLLLVAILTGAGLGISVGQSPTLGQTPGNESCIRYPNNPVFVAPKNDTAAQNGVSSTSVIQWQGRYYMFYTNDGNVSSIGLATSLDGVNWTNVESQVLGAGGAGSWDSGGVYQPSVIWNGSEFLMYYSGYSSKTPAEIGLAVSHDLMNWTRYSGNPIVAPGPEAYDSVSLTHASVIYDPPTYKMWYGGRFPVNYTHTIDYATSLDGIHWTKNAANPVLTVRDFNIPSLTGPSQPSVAKINSTYLMAIYYGGDADLDYASSLDGIHWTVGPTHFLVSPNNTVSLDATPSYPSLLSSGTSLLLWYTRLPNNASQPTIGLAFCSLVVVENTTTTKTSTLNEIQTSTISLPRATTTTSFSTIAITETSSSAPVFEGTTFAAVVVIVALLYLLVRKQSK